jgi:hypothetical protein
MPMASGWDRQVVGKPVQALFSSLALALRRTVAAMLAGCLIVSLVACAGPGGSLSGSYVDDTMTVAEANPDESILRLLDELTIAPKH